MATRVSTKSLPGAAAGPDKLAAGGSASRVQSVDRAARLLRAVAAAGSRGREHRGARRGLRAQPGDGVADPVHAGDPRAGQERPRRRGLDDRARRLQPRPLGRPRGPAAREPRGRRAAGPADGRDRRPRRTPQRRAGLRRRGRAAVGRRGARGATSRSACTPPRRARCCWRGRSEEDVARLLPRRLERFTDSTITGRAALRAELDRVRRQGYATCDGEYDPAACGVSAPVLDGAGRLLAIVSVWGPPPRVAPDRFPALGALTMEAAARMAPPPEGQTAAASADIRICCWRPRSASPVKIASASQTSAKPTHLTERHRLVEDEQAQQELDRRREVLQQAQRRHRDPDGGAAEADQRHRGDQSGGREQHHVPRPVPGEAATARRR